MEATRSDVELHAWDYRDPEELIREVASRVPLRAGDVYLVLVAHPSQEQRIERIHLLDCDAEQDDYEHASRALDRVVGRWPIPDVRPPTHGVMTVAVRPGRTVLGRFEYGWLLAWRYCDHLRQVWDSDLILVTEHGWVDTMTLWGGSEPAMVAS